MQKVRAGSLMLTLAFALCAQLASLTFSDVSAAEPGSLEGAWSGTGSVSFATGIANAVEDADPSGRSPDWKCGGANDSGARSYCHAGGP